MIKLEITVVRVRVVKITVAVVVAVVKFTGLSSLSLGGGEVVGLIEIGELRHVPIDRDRWIDR